MAIEKFPIIHLAIDIQDRFLACFDKPRAAGFPASIRNFADELRLHGIPTLWAVLPHASIAQEFKLYDRLTKQPSLARARNTALLKKFGLTACHIRDDEEIFVKYQNNAFRRSRHPLNLHFLLADKLAARQTRDLIITGMNTRACVRLSVRGALRSGFRCHVMSDLLADGTAKSQQDADPAWHRSRFLREQLKYPRAIQLWNSAHFLRSLDTEIAPFIQQIWPSLETDWVTQVAA